MFDGSDGRIKTSVYRPFGEAQDWTDKLAPAVETKCWIGERYDAGAGLQYLNARYYDPELGLFIQPDWWEVTTPGVGTNRYSYAFNDPVNLRDPEGNAICGGFCIGVGLAATIAYFSSADPLNAPTPEDVPLPADGAMNGVRAIAAPVDMGLTVAEGGGVVDIAMSALPGNVRRTVGNGGVFSKQTIRTLERQGLYDPSKGQKLRHVVESAGGGNLGNAVRSQLDRAGISLNDVGNGVGLKYHGGGHRHAYMEAVEKRLSGLTGRYEILEELAQIRKELKKIDDDLGIASRNVKGDLKSDGDPDTIREWVADQ